jgi:3-phosphoshikimate 1-carboxyvinyltransferase
MNPPMREIFATGVPDATLAVPGSKSLTNRGLAIGALARGETVLTGALFCEDTLRLAGALRELGIEVREDPAAATIRVTGGGGRLPGPAVEVSAEASGTALRFLTALATLANREIRIDGTEGLRRRPVEPLCFALRSLGADARASEGGGAPVVVRPSRLPGGSVPVPADMSSQFASALLLIAPCLPKGLILRLAGPVVSAPYLGLTLAIMSDFGAEVCREGDRSIRVRPGGYRGREVAIEGDATSASYLFAAAAVTGGRVAVTNLDLDGGQGDLAILDVLSSMGATVAASPGRVEVSGPIRRGVDVDLRDAPDLVPTVAALGMIAPGRTRIHGVPHLRVKESDRIESSVRAVQALGGTAVRREDGLEVVGGAVAAGVVDPMSDHRIAMAFSVLGLTRSGIRIRDPGCVAKSFPSFFEVLDSLVQ